MSPKDGRVRTIAAAPPGWRHVSAQLHRWQTAGVEPRKITNPELAKLSDDELFFVAPVVCFALVDRDYGGEWHRTVEAITPSDWPQVLEANRGEDGQGHIGYLGPGEELEDDFRDLARELIYDFRGQS